MNMKSTRNRRGCTILQSVIAISAIGCGMVAAAVAQEAHHEVMNSHADITKLCGSKPAIVGHLDGFGGATWFKIVAAEFKDEMAKCPNVKKVIYLDADNNAQKYNSNINSLVAQGANVIVAFAHFGDASIPAFREATKAGVTVVPYFQKLAGAAPKDYAGNVFLDTTADGVRWADWMAKSIKSGNVIFLGGTPGAATSVGFLNGVKKGLKKYPDLHLLEDDYIVTNWNQVDAQKAVSALIAKYPKIDGIISDYGLTTLAAIKVFEQAGLPIPAQATLASDNEIDCRYLDYKKQGKAWQYYSLNGNTSLIRFAARRALAAYEGTKNDEAEAIWTYEYVNSLTGLDPKCDPSLPPDADLSGQLGEEKLKKFFQR